MNEKEGSEDKHAMFLRSCIVKKDGNCWFSQVSGSGTLPNSDHFHCFISFS